MAKSDESHIKGASGGKPVENAVVTALTAIDAQVLSGDDYALADEGAVIINNRTRITELETQVAEIQTMLQKLGIVAGT